MADKYDYIIVGAGIVGLSAVDWYARQGYRVLCLEKSVPGAGQSAGQVRIFRLGHKDTKTEAMAEQAYAGWLEMERRFNKKLFINTGKLTFLSLAGNRTFNQHHSERLTSNKWRTLIPTHQNINSDAIFEPRAGSLLADEVIACLVNANKGLLKKAEVTDFIQTGQEVQVVTTSGRYVADKVLIAAGADTSVLACKAGMKILIQTRHHLRATFKIFNTSTPLPAISDNSGVYGEHVYGCAIDAEHYVIGLSRRLDNLPRYDEVLFNAVRLRIDNYAQAAMGSLRPVYIGERRCVSTYLDTEDEDNFALFQNKRIYALAGHNLFKFSPVWGKWLASKIHD